MAIVYSDARIGAARLPIKRVAAFLVWLAIVSALCWNHVVWRDEVRALSLALAGDSFIDMFRHVPGEGHPAVWYIALRAAHLMIGSSVVLKAVSIATGRLGSAMSGRLSDYIAIARLDHVTKQIFFLPGAIFAYILRGPRNEDILFLITQGLAAAIFVASANYVINEWLDRDFDQHHSTKS